MSACAANAASPIVTGSLNTTRRLNHVPDPMCDPGTCSNSALSGSAAGATCASPTANDTLSVCSASRAPFFPDHAVAVSV